MQVYLSYMPIAQAPLTIQPKVAGCFTLTGTQEARSLQVELSSRPASTKGWI